MISVDNFSLVLAQKTAYECLIEGGYEFIQASPMEDGRFEVVFAKKGKTVTLLTDEPFAGL